MLAMCCAPAWAQTYTDSIGQHSKLEVEAAYTFAEQQLGQNADMPQGVTMVNSNRNVFASEVSYRFAPTHLRFRAYYPMYNEVYINGVLMNNVETGQFRYPTIGGIGIQGLRFNSSLPFQSFYSCTKSAVSSLSEALRIELKPFNIKVSTILPGDVKTEFTARREKNKSNSVYYGERIDKSVEKMERDEQNGMSPSVIAKIALKIAKSKNPPVYVVGGASYKLLVGLSKILPKRLVVWAIGKLYG